jgi:hypothetical protein
MAKTMDDAQQFLKLIGRCFSITAVGMSRQAE